MKFTVSCDLGYNLNSPATFLFAVKCMKTAGQIVLKESLVTSPELDVKDFQIIGANSRLSRLRTFNPGGLNIFYKAEVDLSVRLFDTSLLPQDCMEDLDPEGIPFLFPSRYCQSDILRQEAQSMFGHLSEAHAIASQVSDWIFHNISYVSGSSEETCSAVDTMRRRQGVCRDFAHLGIAMCRALNVPARYMSAYAYLLNPPDFHACFEVLIRGRWFLFDPTRLAPLNGLVRIATGRDAADAAVGTIFGDPQLTKSCVNCTMNDPSFTPITRESLSLENQAITLS